MRPLLMTLFALAACAPDAEPVPGDTSTEDLDARRVHCITSAPDDIWHLAWRLSGDLDADQLELSLRPLFSERSDANADIDTEERPVEVTGDATEDGVSLTFDGGWIEADALVFPGLFTGQAEIEDEPLDVVCWQGTPTPPHHYDATEGQCVDADGKVGRHELPLLYLQETGRGQCADLTDVQLNGDDYNYPELIDWDLSGARLDAVALHFAHLRDVDLRGAELDGFSFGYAEVQGVADEHTVPPAGFEVAYGTVDWWN